MNRILLAAALGLLSNSQLAGAVPPNLLLIIADDCTYRDLEFYGGQAKTPHLNRLAAEGMQLPTAFSRRRCARRRVTASIPDCIR